MTERKFTDEQFIKAMREAVAERGEDYVYPKAEEKMNEDLGYKVTVNDDYHGLNGVCQYQTPDGTPACIVGLALSKIDPILVPRHGDATGAHEVLRKLGASYEVRKAASEAQQAQDQGATWGRALEEFENSLEEVRS
ncbi:hypothetical protein SEA_DEJAVU_109 [Microbacterium Phage DejaVu]|nr:hypothetical protein SEA_DEJAVU_109 [Microbacterium Phage DejaVu]